MELFEKYGCKTALKSPAHITLVSPFALAFDQAQEIVSHFEGYIPVVHAFELKITGFNTFEIEPFMLSQQVTLHYLPCTPLLLPILKATFTRKKNTMTIALILLLATGISKQLI